MILRIVKLDEVQFLTCIKHSLWGRNNPLFNKWKADDLLAFKVGNFIAGLASVTGDPYMSDEEVWDNGLFLYRIPISFTHILSPEHRLDIEDIKFDLIASWGLKYGVGILNQSPLKEEYAQNVYNKIIEKPNDLEKYQSKINTLISQAKKKS